MVREIADRVAQAVENARLLEETRPCRSHRLVSTECSMERERDRDVSFSALRHL
jgi:GAF domain-containing protein